MIVSGLSLSSPLLIWARQTKSVRLQRRSKSATYYKRAVLQQTQAATMSK